MCPLAPMMTVRASFACRRQVATQANVATPSGLYLCTSPEDDPFQSATRGASQCMSRSATGMTGIGTPGPTRQILLPVLGQGRCRH